MNLHEQYDALIARGMPEHPRLQYVPDDGEPYEYRGCWEMQGVFVHHDDARDLITMHALRWVRTVEHDAGDFWYVMQRIGEEGECAASLVATGTAPTILEAILAATEHLAPKATRAGEGERS